MSLSTCQQNRGQLMFYHEIDADQHRTERPQNIESILSIRRATAEANGEDT
jgi:hypothetical protein